MSTTTEQNKTVIRRFFDAWNSRQPDAFDDLIAPDVVRHCEATPGVEARNLDQIKEFLRQDTAVFPDSVQTIKLLVAEENLVAAWATYEGAQQGPMGPFPPSGRKAQFDFGAVFRIEGGKIAEWWVTWDNMTIFRRSATFRVDERSENFNRSGREIFTRSALFRARCRLFVDATQEFPIAEEVARPHLADREPAVSAERVHG